MVSPIAVMKTILSHANLIDCVEPQVRPDTAVLIEDGRIRAILPSRSFPLPESVTH
jgi:cytosine/adenosine deaminase-related metal-dependent hydrolase